jgi:large subunit ribosomal protein L2
MGKRLIPQRRGRGGSHYRSPSHRHLGIVKYPKVEGEGEVLDIIHSPGHTSPVAVVRFEDENVLMLACEGMKLHQKISVGTGEVARGNVLQLRDIPEGTPIAVRTVQGTQSRMPCDSRDRCRRRSC